MMKIFKLHGEYIDNIFGCRGSVFFSFIACLSAASLTAVVAIAWILFLTGEISLVRAIIAPIVFPLPVHLLHIFLFAAWAIKQKERNQ